MLTKKQITEVCLAHQPPQACRYLEFAMDGTCNCCKKVPKLKQRIDKNLFSLELDCKKKKIDIKTIGVNLGDNCTGYLYLKNILQGYDKKA